MLEVSLSLSPLMGYRVEGGTWGAHVEARRQMETFLLSGVVVVVVVVRRPLRLDPQRKFAWSFTQGGFPKFIFEPVASLGC